MPSAISRITKSGSCAASAARILPAIDSSSASARLVVEGQPACVTSNMATAPASRRRFASLTDAMPVILPAATTCPAFARLRMMCAAVVDFPLPGPAPSASSVVAPRLSNTSTGSAWNRLMCSGRPSSSPSRPRNSIAVGVRLSLALATWPTTPPTATRWPAPPATTAAPLYCRVAWRSPSTPTNTSPTNSVCLRPLDASSSPGRPIRVTRASTSAPASRPSSMGRIRCTQRWSTRWVT